MLNVLVDSEILHFLAAGPSFEMTENDSQGDILQWSVIIRDESR